MSESRYHIVIFDNCLPTIKQSKGLNNVSVMYGNKA